MTNRSARRTREAIAAEYDNDGEWPCDKFDDAPASGGGGSHNHDTGFLASSYKSGRSAVWSYMSANHGVSGWINSDWRCPEGNEQEGGTSGSRHVQGLAGDFDATGFNLAIWEMFDAAATAAGRRWRSEYGTGFDAGGNRRYTSHIHIDWN